MYSGSLEVEPNRKTVQQCCHNIRNELLNMSLLALLFRGVSVPVLSEWVAPIDFLQYDTALCNTTERPALIDIVQIYSSKFQSFLLSKKCTVPLSVTFVSWMLKRNLVLGDVCLSVTNEGLYSLRNENICRINTLLNVLDSVKSLKMSLCAADNVELLAALLSKCTNLEHLALTNSLDIDGCIEYAARFCPKLKSCNLSRCTNVSEEALAFLCRGCPKLSKIGLNHCTNVSRALLLAITVHCAKLQELCLEGCTKLTHRDIHMMSLHCRSVLSRITYSFFNDLSLRTFTWYIGRDLQKLKISDSHKVTNASIMDLSQACPQLTNLNISYCRNITDSAVVSVCQALPEHLLSLSVKCLYETTNESITALTSNCLLLKELHVCGNTRITSKSLRSISLLGWTLKSLSLIAMSLTDDLLVEILVHCRVLEELDISYNSTLTDGALVRALPHCKCVENFQLQCCDNLSDLSLSAIAQHCWRLVALEVNDCKRITDAGVCEVLRICGSSLTLLDLSDCKLAEDTTDALIMYGGRLTTLDIRGTLCLECVTVIVEALKKLRKLKTTEIVSAKLRAVNPDLFICDE